MERTHAAQDASLDPSKRRRARAATQNNAGRFERLSKTFESDGWEAHEDTRLCRTELREEPTARLITYNRSPDLPFDRSINPYRGCEHGCIYCFARPTHAYLGLSPGLDFETRLTAKPGAAEALLRDLRRKGYKPATIALGTSTDPYQAVEQEAQITRACLKVLAHCNHPVGIVTKGTLIERDIDILAPMAAKGLVRVGLSVTTLDAALSRKMEPRAPSPKRRLATIARLSEAGIPVRIMTSPIVPGLTCHEVEALLEAGKGAGAVAASWVMLRLPREVAPLFEAWLEEAVPLRAKRVMGLVRDMHGGKSYDARWGHRMRGEGPYAAIIAQRFAKAARRLGLDRPQPALRCDLFAPPARRGDQLSLFDGPRDLDI